MLILCLCSYCRHFVLCKVASKTKHSDSLVLVSEFLVVVILSVSELWSVDPLMSKFVIRIHCSKDDILLSNNYISLNVYLRYSLP